MSNTPHDLATATTARDLRAVVRDWRMEGLSVGVVPTMGALHEGHLTLIRSALATCDRVVVTLFVNPTQFGPGEDYAAYPRDQERDTALIADEGAHLLFAPSVAEMYGEPVESDVALTEVHVPGLDSVLEGAFRPGHFIGVATVVAKLLNLVQADHAFFGEKDYQQLQVITRMAYDLNIPTEIHGVETVREADGLAMSSRNVYLKSSERAVASQLYATLQQLADDFRAGGQGSDAGRLELKARERLAQAGFTSVDYITIVDATTLAPVNVYDPQRPARVLVAAKLGRARLIDNISIQPTDPA